MSQQDIREYEVSAMSTDVFGRVLCQSRNHHFVVDGPEANGCPGEAITPAEVFLSGVAACGVESLQVLAGQSNFPLSKVNVEVIGRMDRSKPVHPRFTVFNSVHVQFKLDGVDDKQAAELIESFKGR